MQARMWDGQLRVVQSHPYMSTWPQWPLLSRPIWYAFDKEGARQEFVRGVLLLGNPLVMWAGFLAWLGCLWAWLARRSRPALLITYFYGVLYFSWAAIPRKVSFYYYYYPAAMTLSLALGFIWWRARLLDEKNGKWLGWGFLAASALLFAYFYPILAGVRIDADAFSRWMWFRSWI
jgi:dolichyl-phosphate-mannose--protein O-mannosyl transferase